MKDCEIHLLRSIAFLGLMQLSFVAQASTFIGDVCFELQLPDEEESEFMKLGISEVGAGHYMAHGFTYSSLAEPAEDRTLLHGNVEVLSSTISLSLVGSFSEGSEMLSITAHANLSALSLSGPVSILGTFYDFEGEESGVEAQVGFMSPVACEEA